MIFFNKLRRQRKELTSPSIFISYSHADSAVARHLEISLRSISMEPIIDYQTIASGESLNPVIKRLIANVDKVIVLMSESSVNSQWVEQEVRWALRKGKNIIIPVELEKNPSGPVVALLEDIKRSDGSESLAKPLGELIEKFHDVNRDFLTISDQLARVKPTLFSLAQLMQLFIEELIILYEYQKLPAGVNLSEWCYWDGSLLQQGESKQQVLFVPDNDDLETDIFPDPEEWNAREPFLKLKLLILSLAENLLRFAYPSHPFQVSYTTDSFELIKSYIKEDIPFRLFNFLSIMEDLGKPDCIEDLESIRRLSQRLESLSSPHHTYQEKFENTFAVALTQRSNVSIALVLLTSKGNLTLEASLSSAMIQRRPPDEIILIEDEPSSHAAKLAQTYKVDRYVTLGLKASRSQMARRSEARQVATELSKCDVLFYLDGDTVLTKRVLEVAEMHWKMVSEYARSPFSFVLQTIENSFRTRKVSLVEVLEFAGKLLDEDQLRFYSPYVGYRGGLVALSSWRNQPSHKRGIAGDISWSEVRSRCWMVDRQTVLGAGGWDKSFVGYGEEEIDLSCRMLDRLNTSFHVLADRNALGIHVNHRVAPKRKEKELIANAVRNIRKNPWIKEARLEYFEEIYLREMIENQLQIHDSV